MNASIFEYLFSKEAPIALINELPEEMNASIFEYLFSKEVCILKRASQFVKSCAETGLARPREIALLPVKGCAVDEYDINPEIVAKTFQACPSITDIACVLNAGSPSAAAHKLEPLCFGLYDDYTRATVSLVEVLTGFESGPMIARRLRTLRLDLSLLEMDQLKTEVAQPSAVFPNLTTLDVTFEADAHLGHCFSSLSEWEHVETLNVRVKWSPGYALDQADHDLSGVEPLANLKALTITADDACNFERVYLRNAVRDIAPCVKSHMNDFTLEISGGLEDWNGAYAAWEEVLEEMRERLEEVLAFRFAVARPTDTLVLMCSRQ